MGTNSRRTRGILLAGLVLVVGVALAAYTAVNLTKDLSLWMFGERVDARVVESWAEPRGSAKGGQVDFRYYLRYQFANDEGEVFTNISQVSPTEWVGLGRAGTASSSHDPFGPDQDAVAPVHHEQAHIPEFTMGGAADEGATISVVYFPPLPSHNRLDETRFLPILACSYLPLLLLVFAAFVVGRQWLADAKIMGDSFRSLA